MEAFPPGGGGRERRRAVGAGVRVSSRTSANVSKRHASACTPRPLTIFRAALVSRSWKRLEHELLVQHLRRVGGGCVGLRVMAHGAQGAARTRYVHHSAPAYKAHPLASHTHLRPQTTSPLRGRREGEDWVG